MIHLISLREFALFLSQLREEVRWVVCFSSLSYLTTSVICNQNQHASHLQSSDPHPVVAP